MAGPHRWPASLACPPATGPCAGPRTSRERGCRIAQPARAAAPDVAPVVHVNNAEVAVLKVQLVTLHAVALHTLQPRHRPAPPAAALLCRVQQPTWCTSRSTYRTRATWPFDALRSRLMPSTASAYAHQPAPSCRRQAAHVPAAGEQQCTRAHACLPVRVVHAAPYVDGPPAQERQSHGLHTSCWARASLGQPASDLAPHRAFIVPPTWNCWGRFSTCTHELVSLALSQAIPGPRLQERGRARAARCSWAWRPRGEVPPPAHSIRSQPEKHRPPAGRRGNDGACCAHEGLACAKMRPELVLGRACMAEGHLRHLPAGGAQLGQVLLRVHVCQHPPAGLGGGDQLRANDALSFPPACSPGASARVPRCAGTWALLSTPAATSCRTTFSNLRASKGCRRSTPQNEMLYT